MILAVDIGNSEITLGGFEGDTLCFSSRIATDTTKTEDEYAIKLHSALALHKVEATAIKGAIVSSVVPQLNSRIKKAIRFCFHLDALTVGPGIKTGIAIQCDMPSSVGADLICACVAAYKLYKGPALVIDIGTATKMMVVNQSGAFIGASIIPGVLMGLNALANETAQLPSVDLEAPALVIGKNTVDCMKSGIVFGHASMLDGMIDRVFDEYGKTLPVYVTGGLAPAIAPYCKHKMLVNEQLVLIGLNILYQKNS